MTGALLLQQCWSLRRNSMDRAKMLYLQETGHRFKLDHIWGILKDCEKFSSDCDISTDGRIQSTNNFLSHSDFSFSPSSQPMGSADYARVNLDTSDGSTVGSSHGRPIGVKNVKEKRKTDDEDAKFKNMIAENSSRIADSLAKAQATRERMVEIQAGRLPTARLREQNKITERDNNIMMLDLNSLTDPLSRQHFFLEKQRISQKRAEEGEHSGGHGGSSTFNQLFTDFG